MRKEAAKQRLEGGVVLGVLPQAASAFTLPHFYLGAISLSSILK